jgi:hypothetical protein
MTFLQEKRRELYVLLACVFTFSAAVIWVRTATVKDTYLYVQQEKELRRLQQELQAARVQWLKMTAPKRLDALAHNLGLHPPQIHQILKYESDKLSGVSSASR